MKIVNTKIYLFLLVVMALRVSAQVTSENYIKTYRAMEGLTTTTDLSTITDKTKVAVSVTYMDGLGRPVQSVMKQNSPAGFDVVSFWMYDEYGRKAKSFLPYATSETSGSSKTALQTTQASFYNSGVVSGDGQSPFTVQVFENSELNRIIKTGAPGTAWQPQTADPNSYSIADNTIKKVSLYNTDNEVMKLQYVNASGLITFQQFYDPNMLYANKTFDEKNNILIEFVDKEGRTICKKVQSSGTLAAPVFAETYYIYDDFGNLVVVLPPEGVEKMKSVVGN